MRLVSANTIIFLTLIPITIMRRISFLLASFSVAFASMVAASNIARAETYPNRPITFVVPSPAGGTTDLVARIVGKKMSEILGQPIIVENRPGANGYIGTNSVLRAPKDGYQLIVMSGSLHSFTPAMTEKMPFDPIDDFALVSRLIMYPYILTTGTVTGITTLDQLIAQGRNRNSKLSYGSYGIGSAPHLITEWFKMKSGIEAVHIPYKGGGQSAQDLIGGQISFMFSSLPAASGQIKSGQIKALAVTSATRDPDYPGIPAMAEKFPGLEVVSWLGFGAAKGTPPAITDKLRAVYQTVAKDPDFIRAMKEQGANVVVDSSAKEFRDFMVLEKQKWENVVRTAKIPKNQE